MEKFENQKIKALLDLYKPLYALNHASALLGWDTEVYMPPAGVTARGIADSQLSLLYQKTFLSGSFRQALEDAGKQKDLNDYESGVVRVLNRESKVMELPPRLIEEESLVSTTGFKAWEAAKEKSDFKIFQPYLEKIVEIDREKADKLGYSGSPYNALLDLYEEGVTVNDIDAIFSELIPKLKTILGKVVDAGVFTKESKLSSIAYDVSAAKAVNEEIVKIMIGPYRDRFRLDVSTHPFTTDMDVNDARSTTRYEGIDFKSTLYSTMHESGHAIYMLQTDPVLDITPLSGGASTGIHESQSRFFENVIGRSREFTHAITPMLKGKFSFLNGYSEDDIYFYFNQVKPGFIRVDADELTYNFHIALRYDLERQLMEGKANVNELPELWNSKMEEYLGIRPRNDGEGVLQDVHWSSGLGYFPTYSLGNIVAALIGNKIRTEYGNLNSDVSSANFIPLKAWLGEKIHKFSSVYPPKELLRRSFGEGYNPGYLIDYLEDKFTK
jgi:carboxypeptidase Taq